MSKQTKTNVPIVTIAVFIATFMAAIEGTIVATALPTIVGDLQGVKLMNWIVAVYLLTSAMATPVFGKFSDKIGRKPVFLLGLLVFIVGSTLSGLSQSMPILILCRAIQGIGAGAVLPMTYTVIADIYPIEKRARVLGFNGSAWGIASVIAPLLGGFLVDQLSWHWIFFINVPLGLAAMIVIYFNLAEYHEVKSQPIDFLGIFWLVLTLLLVMLGFQSLTGTNGILILIVTLLLGAGTLTLFVRREKRAPDPIMNPKLFKNRAFVIANVVAALISGFVIGYETYMPMWVQGLQGKSATFGGLTLTPTSLLWVAGSFISGRLLVKIPVRRILALALTLLLAGAVILVLLPQWTPYWVLLLMSAGLGLGFGMTITTTTVRSQTLVDPQEVGVATSFNTLCITLGQTLMISIYGVVMNLRMAQGVADNHLLKTDMLNKLINPQTAQLLPAALRPALRHILYEGLHHIYFFSVGIVVLALVINAFDRKKQN